MSEIIDHKCGICVTHSLHNAYSFLKDLQHRGREAAGIAAISDNRIDVIKWIGTIDAFNINTLHNSFSLEERIVDNAITAMETNLPKIPDQMPNATDLDNLYGLSIDDANAAINSLNQKISQRNSWLNIVDTSYRNGYPALLKALDLAAQYKVPKTGAVYDEYNELYDRYVSRAQSLVRNLKARISNDRATLTSLKTKINPAGTVKALQLLDLSVAPVLVAKIDANSISKVTNLSFVNNAFTLSKYALANSGQPAVA